MPWCSQHRTWMLQWDLSLITTLVYITNRQSCGTCWEMCIFWHNSRTKISSASNIPNTLNTQSMLSVQVWDVYSTRQSAKWPQDLSFLGGMNQSKLVTKWAQVLTYYVPFLIITNILFVTLTSYVSLDDLLLTDLCCAQTIVLCCLATIIIDR